MQFFLVGLSIIALVMAFLVLLLAIISEEKNLLFFAGLAVLTNGVILIVQTSLMGSPTENASSIYAPWVSYFFVACKYCFVRRWKSSESEGGKNLTIFSGAFRISTFRSLLSLTFLIYVKLQRQILFMFIIQ